MKSALAALAICLLLFAPTSAYAARAEVFPCRWNYDFYVGLKPGVVTGGANADCSGTPGRLTLTLVIYQQAPTRHDWTISQRKIATWTNPSGNRYIELSRRCTVGKVRASFSWTLRDKTGHPFARNTVLTVAVEDPGPGCKYSLG